MAQTERQLRNIRTMVDEDRNCVDILGQAHAVRRSLDRSEALLLSGHLAGCMLDGSGSGGTTR